LHHGLSRVPTPLFPSFGTSRHLRDGNVQLYFILFSFFAVVVRIGSWFARSPNSQRLFFFCKRSPVFLAFRSYDEICFPFLATVVSTTGPPSRSHDFLVLPYEKIFQASCWSSAPPFWDVFPCIVGPTPLAAKTLDHGRLPFGSRSVNSLQAPPMLFCLTFFFSSQVPYFCPVYCSRDPSLFHFTLPLSGRRFSLCPIFPLCVPCQIPMRIPV